MKNPIPEIDLSEILKRPSGVLAIDPGLSGAAVVLREGSLYAQRDFKELPDIVRAVRAFLGSTYSLAIGSVVIEAVHAMPGQGVCSMFSFGEAYGVAEGAVWSFCHAPVTFVSPQKWQNWYRGLLLMERGEQFDSRAIAVSIFPEYSDLFRRKKDHNTADAALLALYGLATR